MKEIISSKGQKFLVDDEDFLMVRQHKWHVMSGQDGHLYASSSSAGLMHRFITKAPRGMMVDHINNNGLDNRRCNLRVCTNSQNQANRVIGKNNTSGFKGVSRVSRSKKWSATIGFNGRSIYLGQFITPEEASVRYKIAAKNYFGEYAHKVN